MSAPELANRDAIRAAIPSFPDYLNGNLQNKPDPFEVGDCTCAAFVDGMVLTSALTSGGQATIPWPAQDDVLSLFASVGGVDPKTATPEQLEAIPGLDPVDVLQFVMQNGFPVKGGPVVPKAWALGPQDQTAVQKALKVGVLYSAVMLHEADEEALQAGGPLVVTNDPGDIVGGHMITPFEIDDNNVLWIATYGGWVPSTLAWLMARGSAHFLLGWEPPVTPAAQDFGAVDWSGV